eukprot:664565-Amphidinium_carterae.1
MWVIWETSASPPTFVFSDVATPIVMLEAKVLSRLRRVYFTLWVSLAVDVYSFYHRVRHRGLCSRKRATKPGKEKRIGACQ